MRSLTTADTQRRCSSDCEVVGAIMVWSVEWKWKVGREEKINRKIK